MNIPLALAMSAIIFTAATGAYVSTREIDHPVENEEAVAEVDKYRMFVFVADQYAKANPVTATTTVQWPTLRTSSAAPPAVANVTMPSSWKIVQFSDGTWVGCTDLKERSVTAIAQLIPPETVVSGGSSTTTPEFQPLKLGGATAVTHVVLGKSAEASSLANNCL